MALESNPDDETELAQMFTPDPGSYPGNLNDPSAPITANTCTSIRGLWSDHTIPGAAWNLKQDGVKISGSALAQYAGCTSFINYHVRGQRVAGGSFALTADQPYPPGGDSCGHTSKTPIQEMITLSFPACSAGSGTYSDPELNATTTWTRISLPNLTPSIAQLDNQKFQVVHGTTLASCDAKAPQRIGSFFGWQQCLLYTILNGDGSTIQDTSNYTFGETVEIIDSTSRKTRTNVLSGNYALPSGGQIGDVQSALSRFKEINPNYREVLRQTMTVSDISNQATIVVRVNCLIKTATGLKIRDITTSGSCNAQSN